MPDTPVTISDRLEDNEGHIWNVTDVVPVPGRPAYIIIERMVPTTRSISADLIGPRYCQYRKIEDDDA